MNSKSHLPQKPQYIHGSSPDEQQRLSKLNELLNQRCLAQLQLQGGERILDVGSGLGQFTLEMAQQAGNQAFVLGIERDDAQLAQARLNLSNIEDRDHIEFRAGDAYTLPLNDTEWGTFDVVFARFLLEHLAHPEIAVQQMIKAVRPGGRVILVDDDHAVHRLWPEPPEFLPLWEAYVGLYSANGNDPFIGRRLVSLLHEARVRELRNTGLFFGGAAGTDDFALVSENSIAVFIGAKEQLIAESPLTEDGFTEGIAALRQWQMDPSAALWYNLCWAEGTR